MNKIGFLEFFGSFLPPHNLRPALADAKIVAGELDRESRSLEAEVEFNAEWCRSSVLC